MIVRVVVQKHITNNRRVEYKRKKRQEYEKLRVAILKHIHSAQLQALCIYTHRSILRVSVTLFEIDNCVVRALNERSVVSERDNDGAHFWWQAIWHKRFQLIHTHRKVSNAINR